MPDPDSPASVIYVRLPNWVGDVCMSLPSLDALLATGLPVVACARPWARDLLAAYPLAGFIPMGGRWLRDLRLLRLARARTRQQTLGLLLPDSLSSAGLFRLAAIPAAGYRDDGRSLLLRWPVNKQKKPLHAVHRWHYLTCTAMELWGLGRPAPLADRNLAWRNTPTHERQAAQALRQAGLTPGGFILIAPTATGRHKGNIKVWPGFAALTRELQARGMAVATAPPAAEREQARAAAPTATLLPELSLGAFAALTRQAALVVCNDSGVSHLCAAAVARQLTLFGATDPANTGPWSEQAACLGSNGAWPSETAVLDAVLEHLPSTA